MKPLTVWPIILGTNNTTGIKLDAYRKLKKLLNFEAEEKFLYDWPELKTVLVDEPILERLHSDARGVWDRFPAKVLEYNQNRAHPRSICRRLERRPARN